ncbi:MAG: transporter substrate-binding protein, partial [Dehalococcoidia bacterium]|nr:transporter substrate-binding protein [Dehalococcoidia bacterium]
MFRFSRKSTGAFGVILAGLMVLSGCGSAAEPTTAPTVAAPTVAATMPSGTAVPAGSPTVAPVPTPVPGVVVLPNDRKPIKGGTSTTAQNGDPPTFNIYGTTLGITTKHTSQTHNRLIRYKSENWPENAKEGELAFVGDLAESWDVSKDGTVFTIHLRKGVKWHNVKPLNGRELTSADILGSWDRQENHP